MGEMFVVDGIDVYYVVVVCFEMVMDDVVGNVVLCGVFESVCVYFVWV